MADVSHLELGQRARRLRVDTLARLRWLAISGQSVAVLFVHYGLGFSLPLAPCFAIIALSAWLNVALRLRFPRNHRLSEGPASILLAYDVLQLSALLFLTGGLENPFSLLFLAPIMIAAVSLRQRHTLVLGALVVAAATVLTFWHYPLPWSPRDKLDLPTLFVIGEWVAIVLGAAFILVYATRVAEESRRLAEALAATELVLAREQHLTQLDGLAAAAAHELGTPLATITLVVKELQGRLATSGDLADDLALLSQEVRRCRTILTKLTSLSDEPGGVMDRLSLGLLVEEIVQPHRDFGVSVEVTLTGDGNEPEARRNPGILYGLGNLVENAIDFAESTVRITARWDAERVTLVIEDDGPGFAPGVQLRLGEPYVTTRGSERRLKSEEGGLGLGLFIAKTLLERSAASVTMGNIETPGRGARVSVVWPREQFERPRPADDLP